VGPAEAEEEEEGPLADEHRGFDLENAGALDDDEFGRGRHAENCTIAARTFR